MGSQAQDAISFGLDLVVAPDGREWCNSAYGQSSVSREIWGDLQDGCSGHSSQGYNDSNDYDDEDEKVEAHSERVWNKMGYRVKYGETYAYRHYGNEIFTEDQVVKKNGRGRYGRKKNYKRARESETHTYDGWS